MRNSFAVCALAWIVLASGCGSHPEGPTPLAKGTLEGGTFWKNPLSATSNEGGGYPKGSHLELYDQFVLVTTPDGTSYVHPHGYYSGLSFKKE